MVGTRPDCLYVDTRTINNIASNGMYITDVKKVKQALNLHTNTRTTCTDLKGKLGCFTFWLEKFRISNVISFRSLEKVFHVTYASNKNRSIL